jgi:3-dehydroquinate synthase
MERMGAGRRCKDIFIVALGGGVVGDLAGFVSSIFKRGIPYIQVPTTLLAQVDSAIGGKTAVDLTYAKNMAGAFYQPRMVISDVGLLKSLPDRQIRSGLAEVIKYGVIADGSLFAYIEENLDRILRLEPCALEYAIASCSRIKARIVESDERDTGLRRIVLNYGHTIGHAIESAASYSRLYTHGEAVAIGMVVAADIAREIGMLKPSDAERIESLIARAGLPTSIRSIKSGRILRSHLNDKKFTLGVNRFVLPRSIGSAAVVRNVPYKVVGDAIRARAHPAA